MSNLRLRVIHRLHRPASVNNQLPRDWEYPLVLVQLNEHNRALCALEREVHLMGTDTKYWEPVELV